MLHLTSYPIEFLEDAKEKLATKGGKKGTKLSKKIKKEEKNQANKNQDYETFLRDLEEDKGNPSPNSNPIEMRSLITLYKDDEQVKGVTEKLEQVALAEEDKEDSDVEEDFPDVHVDELE